MIRAAALLLAALAPLPALAQSAPITATVDPTRRALALELATLLNPEAPLMAAMEVAFGDSLPRMLLADPQMKALEDQHPGLAKAMADAMRPILLRYLRQSIPELRERMAVIYSDLSEEDLRALVAFYRSPTGQRLIELMTSGMDVGGMMDRMIADGDGKTSSEELTSETRTAAYSAVRRLTPAQLQEAGRFGASPAGRRAVALQPRVAAVMAEWSNNPSPEIQAEMEAALVPIVQKFTGMRR